MCPSFRVSLGHFSKWVLQLTKISTYKTLCPYHGTYTIRIRIFTFCLSGSPGAGYRGKSCWWMTDIGFCLKYEGLQWLGGLQWLDACFFTYYLITVSYWDITPIYPSVLYNCTVLYSTDLLSVLSACMYRECTILAYVHVWPTVWQMYHNILLIYRYCLSSLPACTGTVPGMYNYPTVRTGMTYGRCTIGMVPLPYVAYLWGMTVMSCATVRLYVPGTLRLYLLEYCCTTDSPVCTTLLHDWLSTWYWYQRTTPYVLFILVCPG
jgi:hypothetical protein